MKYAIYTIIIALGLFFSYKLGERNVIKDQKDINTDSLFSKIIEKDSIISLLNKKEMLTLRSNDSIQIVIKKEYVEVIKGIDTLPLDKQVELLTINLSKVDSVK